MNTTPSSRWLSKRNMPLLIVGVLLVAAIAFLEYQQYQLGVQIAAVQVSSENSVKDFNQQIEGLHNDIGTLAMQGQNFVSTLDSTKQQSAAVQDQIGQVSATIGSLDKLSKTDPQLLEKYSKVYFLNEHYVPSSLSTLEPQYTFNKDVTYQIHSQVLPHLIKMIDTAKAAGDNLLVISAYRSFGTQSALKSSYKVTYGAGTANSFSADQGYSEHQLGTTVDLTTPKLGASYDNFDQTNEYKWLTDNAYQFGFVLSYPKNNSYYIYEPWHWRYVGVDLATKLHRDGKYFYDLDQRTIDDYLLVLFD